MVLISVCCPRCHSNQVVKCGKTDQSKQRYRCQNEECSTKTFILDYDYNGYLPEVKKKIVDMALNGSGIRDTARVLAYPYTQLILHVCQTFCEGLESMIRQAFSVARAVLLRRCCMVCGL